MTVYLSAITEGFLWGIMGLGLYISFRILRMADLTSEASFTLGASVSVMLISKGIHPIIAIFASIAFGMLAGLITGILTTVFDIPGLLASIITMTGLYSINLRIMGKPNLSYRGTQTLVNALEKYLPNDAILQSAVIGTVFVVILIVLLTYFFRTDFGQAMIATGDNPIMAISFGIRTHRMLRIALMLANGLIALSGSLISQNNGFTDVSMGTGTVVVAMAAIVIGEVLFNKQLSLMKRFVSIILGAIIYRLILVTVLKMGMNPNDFRLISATVLAIFLALPKISGKLSYARNRGER